MHHADLESGSSLVCSATQRELGGVRTVPEANELNPGLEPTETEVDIQNLVPNPLY